MANKSPMPVDLSAVFGLPPEQAIEYFKAKGYAITWDWRDMDAAAHAKAYTVAKVMRVDILQDIRGGLDDAFHNGTTLREFQKNLTPILQAKGWWGRELASKVKPGMPDLVDTATGEIKTVQLGSARRLQTIYQTNLQTAYMAGRYQRMLENIGSHPYWQYVAVLDGRTRPTHRAMNGRVFRHDDAMWDAMYPPNGFNCRCRVSAISEYEAQRDGIKVETSEGRLIDHDIRMKDGSTVRGKALRIKVDGQDKLFAPDAGWSNNPGKAASQGRSSAVMVTTKFAGLPAAMRSAALAPTMIGKVSDNFHKAVNGALQTIPQRLQMEVMARGYQVVMGKSMLEIEPGLTSSLPRGYNNYPVTWANLDGGMLRGLRIAIAETSLSETGELVLTDPIRAAQLLRHEFGHALDTSLRLSSRKEFVTAYAHEAEQLTHWLDKLPKGSDAHRQLAYLLQKGRAGREETFAELFAEIYGGGTSDTINAALAFPDTEAGVKALIDELLKGD